MKIKKTIELTILIAVIVIGFLALKNAVALGDWVVLRNYEPAPEIENLADSSGMSEQGRNLFYRFDPEFVEQQVLDSACADSSEPIGCVKDDKIYILEPTGKAQEFEVLVTAAHELLHVSYSRLSKDEIAQIEPLLNTALKSTSISVLDDISEYSGESQEIYLDEVYAILGSEEDDLPLELTDHYNQYFDNRQLVVDAYELTP